MTHYEVLGVRKTASTAEIRRAYVRLAREHHPDVNAARSSSARADAEREMQRVNAAWAVLGDDQLRDDYDRELRAQAARPTPKPRQPSGMANPDFVPFDAGEDVDYAELLDDTPIPGTGVPRWLQLLGPGLLVTALGCFCLGWVTSFPPFVTLAVFSFIGSLVSFLAAPLVAVRHSARSDRL